MSGMLPTWKGPRGGSGCDNEDCTATDAFVRVLSVEEIERVYPHKDALPTWPIPEQATHMCTSCGFVYEGVESGWSFESRTDTNERTEVRIEEWDWDPEDSWDVSVRDATKKFIESAPDDATADEIVEGVYRYVPGAGADHARDVMEEMDVDVTVNPAAEYM